MIPDSPIASSAALSVDSQQRQGAETEEPLALGTKASQELLSGIHEQGAAKKHGACPGGSINI